REAPMIPGLEGSTHINFRLTVQFIDPYFAAAGQDVPAVRRDESRENPYWFAAHERNAKTVSFEPFLRAYESLRAIPNIPTFVAQAEAFRQFASGGDSARTAAADTALLVAIGKCFATIAYAQLVAENCVLAEIPPALI